MIQKEEEVIDLTETQGDMQIEEEELEEGEVIEEEEPPKLLTDEELEAIVDRVDKREKEDEQKKKRPDLNVKLLEHSINIILWEELHLVGDKMNAFRQVLAEGALKFADSEGARNSKVKLDKLVDSFRAAWKEKEDKKSAADVFMKEMDNELWYPEEVAER